VTQINVEENARMRRLIHGCVLLAVPLALRYLKHIERFSQSLLLFVLLFIFKLTFGLLR
jgi:hypothetical protein